MSSLKAKIVQQLDYLPENLLVQVLDFVQFLTWRKQDNSANADVDYQQKQDTAWLETDLSNLGAYEPYDWQEAELEQGLPVQIDSENGVVIIQALEQD